MLIKTWANSRVLSQSNRKLCFLSNLSSYLCFRIRTDRTSHSNWTRCSKVTSATVSLIIPSLHSLQSSGPLWSPFTRTATSGSIRSTRAGNRSVKQNTYSTIISNLPGSLNILDLWAGPWSWLGSLTTSTLPSASAPSWGRQTSGSS